MVVKKDSKDTDEKEKPEKDEKKEDGENPEDKPADKPDNEAVKKRDPSTGSRNKVSEVINIQHN